MREFTTAVASAAVAEDADVAEPITTRIDGQMITFRGANAGQVSMALAVAQAGTLVDGIGTIINLFFNLIQDNPKLGVSGKPVYNLETGKPVWDVGSAAVVASHFKHRLFDMTDPFGPEQVSEVMTALLEEWTGKAQRSASASSPTRQETGSTSTAPTPESTSSAFGLTASST
jgi:hypothetical protein